MTAMLLWAVNPLSPEVLPLVLHTLLMAALVNIACALVGSFLVLRRMAMMGDALSHAVLPGLILAFLFSGSMGILPMFAGAVAAGMATTFLTQTLHRYGGLATDASMGVVFTSLFAMGVVLVKQFASDIHFDARCVYEGSLLLLAADTISVAGWEVPHHIQVVLPVLLGNLVVLLLLWKEFQLTTFDAALATSMGFSAGLMHYLLMALVAITAVASFEAVGSILVVAMLIIPAAAAQLLVHRLGAMLLTACGLAVLVAIVGTLVAVWWDVSPSGTMAVTAGIVYTMAALFSPHEGIVARAWFHQQTAQRIVREDLLAMLYRLQEHDPDHHLARHDAIAAVGGGLSARRALRTLLRNREVLFSPAGLQLSPSGQEQARQLVRAHRLWETYLVENLGLPLDHVHEPAHRVEHFIGSEMEEQLAETLQQREDPHGREIP